MGFLKDKNHYLLKKKRFHFKKNAGKVDNLKNFRFFRSVCLGKITVFY